MSVSSDYWYWKKKRQEEQGVTQNTPTHGNGVSADYWYWKQRRAEAQAEEKISSPKTTVRDDDIGPVNDRSWFQKGAFEDGYQFGDILKTISSTTRDAYTDLGVGIFNLVENTIDAGATLLSNVPAWEDELSAFVAKDIIDEKKVAGVAALASSLTMPYSPTTIDAVTRIIEGEDWRDVLLGDSYEEDSLLGDKSDSLAQSGGQLLAQFGLNYVGVPWWVTSGVSSYGSQAEQAFQEGATAGEANFSALISAGAEVLSEKIFGGFKFQGKALSDGVSDMISRGVSNKLLKSVMKFGLDAGGESIEEVFSAVASRFGQWLTYQDDKTIGEMLASEEAFDEYLESAIGGGLLGGGNTALNITQNAMAGKDPVSGLSATEEQVVRDLFDSRVAESEKGGKKLSEFEKNKVWDEVIEQMDRGEIDIGDIERILGGDTYKTYQDTVSKEDAIWNEYKTLHQMERGKMTGEQLDREAELKKMTEELDKSTTRMDLASQLRSEVFSVVKDSRLAESYNERVRRGQAFEADVSKYSESERKVIQDAIDSGILNNTRKAHEFVDWVAKVAGAKGLEFKFTNNEKLRGTQFEVKTEDGKTMMPNGYRDGNVIGINTNSKKNVNVVAGHEITHVLEGTPLYQALQDAVFRYAVAKDGQAKFDQRLKAVEKLYEGVSTDAKGELTADLVGEYLFTDKDFIKRLTTENRSLAKKVFDEIKHLWKLATAGSREKKELERVKKAFEKAYREGGKLKSSPVATSVKAETKSVPKTEVNTVPKTEVKVGDKPIPSEVHPVSKSEIIDEAIPETITDSTSDANISDSVDSRGVKLSDAQVAFFKDSKVRDEDGNLLVVYHGTGRAGFNSFDIEGSIFGLFGHGAYFTSDRAEAAFYRDEKPGKSRGVYSVYLNITNPMNMNVDADPVAWAKAFPDVDFPPSGWNEDFFHEAEEHFRAKNNLDEETPTPRWTEMTDAIRGMGYDGIEFFVGSIPELGTRNFVAFDQNQIKNVGNTTPTNDPDIRFSLSEDSDIAPSNESDVQYSLPVTDEETLDFLNDQVALGEYDAETNPNGGYYVTYKSMSFWGYDDEGNAILRSPMAEYVDGKLSDAYLVPKDKSKINWYRATETIDEKTGFPSGLMVETKKPGSKSKSYVSASENQHLIKDDWSNLYFLLKKKVFKNGKWETSTVPARYNPYEHSSNMMLNDQFSAAYLRDNLVTVKMYVPVSEDNGAFRAKWSKDPTGWTDWKSGIVAGKINQQKDLSRRVFLSRYSAPVEIVPDSEVAQAYKEYLEGTTVAIPDNVVSPNLLKELRKAGVKITESGKVQNSLSGDSDIAPTRQGNYHVTGEDISIDTPYSLDDIGPVAEKTTINSDKARSTSPKSEKHIPVEKAVEGHFMDSKLPFDKVSPEVQEKVAGRWKAIKKATKDAHSFVKNGADGVRPLHDIFADANKDGHGGAFEDYLHHRLNVDRMTLSSRFGLKDKAVFGDEVTATYSQQRVAEIESEHPEFADFANEVYSFSTYLRDLLVKGGVISRETADRWAEMYPHYVPIKRIGFGDENHVSDLFNFVASQDESSFNPAEVDAFFGEVENEAPIKEAKGGSQPIKSLEDTLSDRALQTFWTLAMRGVDTTVSSEIAPDATMDQETDVRSEEELARYKPTPSKERSIILKEGRNNFTKSLQEHILDSGYVFEKVSKKTGNRNLEAKWNFRRNAGSMAQRLIDNGDAKHGVPSLKKMHKALKKAGTLDAFSDYLGYKAHVDGMTLQSRFVVANNRSFMGNDVSVFDARDRIAMLEAEHPEFKSLSEGVYRFTNFLTNQLVDNGVISESDAELWREILPHYVPMKSSASEGRVLDALGRFASNVYKTVTTNSFSGELFKTLNSQDSRDLIDIESFMNHLEAGANNSFALTQNNGKYQYTVYENGERVTYEINEEMYEALKPRHVALQKQIPVLSHINSIFRGLTTQYNPVFALTNPIKDLQDVLLNSQHPGMTYANVPRAVGEMFKEKFKPGSSKYLSEYLANGGDTNSYFNSKEGPFAEENVAKKFLDKVFFLNEYIEMAPRLAEYIASRESGRNVETSMLDAARVTTNFAAGGDVTKFFNRNGCTFLNASIQGAIQQVRNVQEAHQKGLMGYVGLVTRCAIGGLAPVLLNNLMWEDDEEYEELADYVKEGYYIIPGKKDGKFVRIPKGRALSVLQEVIDIVMDTASGDDEVDLARFMALGSLAMDNIAPNNPIENNIFAPVMETFYNRTWYGEELVPERLENLPYAEQYDEKIDVVSRALAQTGLGKALNWSPYKINYLLNAYGGGLADILLPMWTPRSESGDDSFLGKLTAPVRDKFVTDSVLNSQTVTDFYDVCDELERNANSMYATEADRFKYMYIESVCFDTNELYAEKRAIQNGDMSESEKYHRVREIQEQINEMMEEALNSYQNPQIDGLYAEVGSKRFNYDEESGNWYPIKETNADGSPNWYYEMEQKVTQGLGISYGEYWNNREEYNFAYEKPGEYALSQAVGGYRDYQTYHTALWDIKADKDEYGQSINGTRKKKVVEYINGLDCEYGMKILLYKSEYPNDDKYNYDIIEYLNEREDISYEQMETILKELGFKVDSKGRITW